MPIPLQKKLHGKYTLSMMYTLSSKYTSFILQIFEVQ